VVDKLSFQYREMEPRKLFFEINGEVNSDLLKHFWARRQIGLDRKRVNVNQDLHLTGGK
jgi:hypothetical protein